MWKKCLCAVVCVANVAHAELLDVAPRHPHTLYSAGTINYDAASNRLTLDAQPLVIQFRSREQVCVLQESDGIAPTMTLRFDLHEDGQSVQGVEGSDFVLIGSVDADGDGDIDYEGVLLNGEIAAFGYRDGPDEPVEVDRFDFRISLRGGSMVFLFPECDLGITVWSDGSNFEGNFTVGFAGGAMGWMGATDPMGACCLATGECVENANKFDCLGAGGIFLGDGAQCDDGPCVPRGACCLFDGSCVDFVTAAACAALGGIYGPDGLRCVFVPCSTRGACCLVDGSCLEGTRELACQQAGGIYEGDGTRCADTRCRLRLGACCFVDDTCDDPVTKQECRAGGGVYQGGGTGCADIVCPNLGACCLQDGSCLDAVTETRCVGVGGLYQGDGSECVNTTCP